MVASRSYWQYRVLSVTDIDEADLTALGTDESGGWELVSVDGGVAYFKRLLSDSDARKMRS